MYFNKKYNRLGSAFQGRFKAKLIDTDEYLLHVSRYIHLNPLEALRAQGPALKLKNYPWSSLKEYIGVSNRPFCKTDIILDHLSQGTLASRKQKYKKFIEGFIKDLKPTFLSKLSTG